MARLEGGIFSRPRGKTAGLVFGAARTRTGKVATARQLVPPSNPNTPAQQTQRSKFSFAQKVVRLWGPSVYQEGFNRAVSQLPGFQSMQSILTKAIDSDLKLTAPPETKLGTLGTPTELSVTPGDDPGQIYVEFGGDLKPNQTNEDLIYTIYVATDEEEVEDSGGKGGGTVYDIRSNVTTELNDLDPGRQYLVGVYGIGQGSAQGLRANCVWQLVNAST